MYNGCRERPRSTCPQAELPATDRQGLSNWVPATTLALARYFTREGGFTLPFETVPDMSGAGDMGVPSSTSRSTCSRLTGSYRFRFALGVCFRGHTLHLQTWLPAAVFPLLTCLSVLWQWGHSFISLFHPAFSFGHFLGLEYIHYSAV
jgi:hypothetical protein